MNWLQSFGEWFRGLFGGEQWVGQTGEDTPDQLSDRTVYLIGDEGSKPWAAVMLCPCGCKEVIQLSLIEDDNPSWRVRLGDKRRVTLHPSVWRVRGCRSHFFVREGRILWTRDVRPSAGHIPAGPPSSSA